jgi:integrase
MSVFRFRNSKVYWMDFFFHGQRIQESTGTRSKTLAKKIQDKRRRELEEGAAGIRKRQQPRLLSVAGPAWLEMKKNSLAAKSVVIETTNLGHLIPRLGRKLVCDIDAHDVANYKDFRRGEGAAAKTVNLELGTLRAVLGPRLWGNIRADAKEVGMKIMFPIDNDDFGRALSSEEETALLYECSRSRSRILVPFVALALDTGARYNTIRMLQWRNIDFINRCIKFGRDKTPAGTGREVPLNQRALQTLKLWAQQFPSRKQEHYVFPAERVGASGDAFEAKVYDTDPSNAIGDIKEAWEASKNRTRRHCPHCKTGTLADKRECQKGHTCVQCHFEVEDLPAGLVGVRFHDLRHTAISRMIAAGVPLPIIAKIVGWSASTMAKMAKRYGHFGLEELRGAVETIRRASVSKSDFEAESLEFSLESQGANRSGVAN